MNICVDLSGSAYRAGFCPCLHIFVHMSAHTGLPVLDELRRRRGRSAPYHAAQGRRRLARPHDADAVCCVCTRGWMRPCMPVHTNACTHAWKDVHTRMLVHIYTRAWLCTCSYTCLYTCDEGRIRATSTQNGNRDLLDWMDAHAHARTHVDAYVYAHGFTHVCARCFRDNATVPPPAPSTAAGRKVAACQSFCH